MDTIKLDLETFNPAHRKEHPDIVLLYVGRVVVDHNLKEFLTLPEDLGRKVIVGSGEREIKEVIEGLYPDTEVLDFMKNEELADMMANADVIISPKSLLVMLEANACGTPVAALPSFTWDDYIVDHLNGVMDEDLALAVVNAVSLDRTKIRQYAEEL